MDVVEIDGLRVAFQQAGTGPAIVFVHGGAEDGRTWAPQLDALADEFTVIAWDEPGAGGSSDVPTGFGLSDYGDCLAGLIRALDVSPCTVVGLSWGVTVILELYRRHPGVVHSLVLADGYAGWRGSLGVEEADARLAGLRDQPDGSFDPTLPGLFAGAPPPAFVPLLEAMSADVRRHSMLTALTAMAQADLTDVLDTIRVPTQLIWGALDARSPLSVAREFEHRIPGADLAVIPGCGHVSNLEAPEAFNDILRFFLRRHG
ncbi:alpha/beta fold hydrolase [Nocardioides sp. NPDC057767]|uniref:alpha/beta fold hydrolase n=1 Tax=unclassified Nocardioides TaxID=2615069 RepID=UPI00366F18DE